MLNILALGLMCLCESQTISDLETTERTYAHQAGAAHMTTLDGKWEAIA